MTAAAWRVLTLSEITLSISNGLTHQNNPSSGGLPLSRIQTISKGEIDFELVGYAGLSEKGNEKYLLNPGDILFSHINSKEHVGKVAICRDDMPKLLHGMNLLRIVANEKVLPKYLFWAFRSDKVKTQIWNNTRHAVNQASINIRNLSNVEVPVPPIDEQRRIVENLDDRLSRLDKAFAELEHADSQSLVLKRSILNSLLAPKASRLESARDGASKLPSDWISQRLGDLALVTMGQSPPGSSYNRSGHGMPFFQGKAEFGTKHPTVRQWTTAGTKFAQPGDILMSVRAPVGPTNIADTICVIGRGLASIRAGERLDQAYLIWFLKHVEASIQARGKGTTFDAISGNDLRDTVISLPPLDEQRRIVEILDQSLSRLDSTTASVSHKKFSIRALRRSLINNAFSGELGTK
jgi:type I restriction enzyme S subunit